VTENFISQTFSAVHSSQSHDVPWTFGDDDPVRDDGIVRQILQRSIQDQIRDRAYELYLQRGCRDGHDMEDWLDAEFEMLSNR